MAKIHADGRVTDASVHEVQLPIEIPIEPETADVIIDQPKDKEVASSPGSNSDQSEKSNESTPKKSARTVRSR